MICEGILSITISEDFESGLKFFERALSLYPNKMEPNLYIFATYIYIYNKNDKSNANYIDLAIQYINKAKALAPANPGVLYYKSLMALVFEENLTVVQDLTQAIEGCDEGKAEYYFLRGIAFADMGLYPQAYSDFSLAISFNSKWPECYYNRAICCQILGDVEGSLGDLKIYLNFGKYKENSDLLVANFLFGCGLYEDAVNNYSLVEEKEIIALIDKVKCLVHMKELSLCLVCLEKLLEATDYSEEFVNDKECLMALKLASQCFSSQEIKTEGNKAEESDKTVEKIENREENQKNEEEKEKEEEYMKLINDVIESGRDGMIFKMSDFHFYKGVFCFYRKEYQESIENFIKGYQLKSFLMDLGKDISNGNGVDQTKTDLLSEVSSFAFHEYLYNLIICYIQVIY